MVKCKLLKTLKNAVFYIVIILLAALCLFIIISKKNGNPPFFFGYTVMWVKTESMEPEIPRQSYILIKRAKAQEIRKNDIITFISDDPLIKGYYNTHRVIEIKGNNEEFVTKGDNNFGEDKYTAKADNIVARYIRVLPFLSGAGKFLSSEIGIMSVTMLMLGLMVLLYLPDMYKGLRLKQTVQEEERKKELDRIFKEEIEKLKAENAEKDDRV